MQRKDGTENRGKVTRTAPPKPVRRKRDKEASKTALLESAIGVFSELGYDAATTKEIARRAKVSEALIQRYFDGKGGLLIEIMRAWMVENAEGAPASLPLYDRLEEEFFQVVTSNCQQHETNRDFMRVAVSRAIVDPELGKQIGSNLYDQRLPALEARLLHYQKTGAIKKETDLRAIAFALSALSFSLGFMGPEVFGFDRKRMEEIAAVVTRLLAKGLQ